MTVRVQLMAVNSRELLRINHGQKIFWVVAWAELRENMLMALHSAPPVKRYVVLPNIVCYCYQCVHWRWKTFLSRCWMKTGCGFSLESQEKKNFFFLLLIVKSCLFVYFKWEFFTRLSSCLWISLIHSGKMDWCCWFSFFLKSSWDRTPCCSWIPGFYCARCWQYSNIGLWQAGRTLWIILSNVNYNKKLGSTPNINVIFPVC